MKDNNIIPQKPIMLIINNSLNAFDLTILRTTNLYDQSRITSNLFTICNRSYANQQSN